MCVTACQPSIHEEQRNEWSPERQVVASIERIGDRPAVADQCRGSVVSWRYQRDHDERIIRATKRLLSERVPFVDEAFKYDINGRLIQMVLDGDEVTTTWTYSDRGELARRETVSSDGQILAFEEVTVGEAGQRVVFVIHSLFLWP